MSDEGCRHWTVFGRIAGRMGDSPHRARGIVHAQQRRGNVRSLYPGLSRRSTSRVLTVTVVKTQLHARPAVGAILLRMRFWLGQEDWPQQAPSDVAFRVDNPLAIWRVNAK
jgi:hypothetical protein